MIRRWLFNIASVVSLLLCLSTIAIWVRSYVIVDHAEYAQVSGKNQPWVRTLTLESEMGGVSIMLESIRCHDPWGRDAVPPSVFCTFARASKYCALLRAFSHEPDAPTILNKIGFFGYFPDAQDASDGVSRFVNYGGSVHAIDYSSERGFTVPYWIVVLLASILPVIFTVRILRRRIFAGCCPICGYKLTANTSGVCPECGTPVPAKPEAVA